MRASAIKRTNRDPDFRLFPGAGLSAWIVVAMLAMVAVPATVTLRTVR
jgi:hypothetical protein